MEHEFTDTLDGVANVMLDHVDIKGVTHHGALQHDQRFWCDQNKAKACDQDAGPRESQKLAIPLLGVEKALYEDSSYIGPEEVVAIYAREAELPIQARTKPLSRLDRNKHHLFALRIGERPYNSLQLRDGLHTLTTR